MPSKEEMLSYFEKKASDYDMVETQLYWKFSDELLWELMKKLVLDKLKYHKIKFMDAGGGTGRWAIKIIEYLQDSCGVICDLSEEMLYEASKKINTKNIGDRLHVSKCNIENMSNEDENTYDLVINFHNVLGFTENPEKALSEMYRVLKKDGFLISVVPNKYHALFFNVSIGRLSDIESLVQNNIGRFVDTMPKIMMFTPRTISKMYENLKINNIKVLGFPVTVYPSIEETKIVGNSGCVKTILGDDETKDKLLSMEKKLIFSEEAASRGNNIFAIGMK